MASSPLFTTASLQIHYSAVRFYYAHVHVRLPVRLLVCVYMRLHGRLRSRRLQAAAAAAAAMTQFSSRIAARLVSLIIHRFDSNLARRRRARAKRSNDRRNNDDTPQSVGRSVGRRPATWSPTGTDPADPRQRATRPSRRQYE